MMATKITVPKLSATMEEAVVLKWLKSPGDEVKEGEVLVELETDKAALEVEATASGVLSDLLAEEGETVAVGAVIAVLGGETIEQVEPPQSDPKDVSKPKKPAPENPKNLTNRPSAPGDSVLRRPKPADKRRTFATPLARRIAQQAGISLDSISGSGPRGRVRRRDVEAAKVEAQRKPELAPRLVTDDPSPATNKMRKRIAEQVTESRRTIPSFTLDRWVNFDPVDEARISLNRRLESESGLRLTHTDFLLQALSDVLPKHERLLSVWDNESSSESYLAGDVAIGLVVGLPDSLMIPVISGIAGMGLGEIAARRLEAVKAARTQRLGAKHSGKAAISISNIGALGVDRFEAIISPGETAILAVGRLREVPVARGRALSVARGATLTLSVDHRVIDGLVGAAFLGDLADRIERETWRL